MTPAIHTGKFLQRAAERNPTPFLRGCVAGGRMTIGGGYPQRTLKPRFMQKKWMVADFLGRAQGDPSTLKRNLHRATQQARCISGGFRGG